jgi:salicylate hydroxylase
MTKSKPRVAIVGGGIGGLFAANALVSQGVPVAVYEQAPALGEIGAGVYLTPNGVRQLQRVGLGPAVEKWGSLIGPQSRYLRHDGTPIAPVQVADASGWNATYGMHRADFVDFLAAHLPPDVVHTGHRAVGFEQGPDKARVTFANGNTIEADVVVGASSRLPSPCSTAPFRTAASFPASACRTGRPTAGRPGPVRPSTS